MSEIGDTQTFALVQATPKQRAQRWRLHHQAWGDGFAMDDYLRREQTLATDDFLRDVLRMWLLVDTEGEPVASCETYGCQLWAADAEGRTERVKCQTIASVLVAPQLRQQGHATQLLRRLGAELRFEGNSALTLYSDVGPQIYRRLGYLLHPARESVLRVDPTDRWPLRATELGMADVADLLHQQAERTPSWLGVTTAPAVAEAPRAERIEWFHLRARARAWARQQPEPQVIGAQGPDGGWVLWTSDAAETVLHVLLWRPESALDARTLTQAAAAQAVREGLTHVVWWDADRDTGLDPWHEPNRRPLGTVDRTRDKGLPMIAWLDAERPMPLIWMGIERFGWA